MSDEYSTEFAVPLHTSMDRFLKHLKSAPVDTLTGLRTDWEQVVGPRLMGVSRPVSLLDGILLISCDDSTWAAQLTWMEQAICRSVKELFPGVALTGIRVRQRHQSEGSSR